MKTIKTCFVILCILNFMCGHSSAQTVSKITSTGKTTGHIATMTVKNTGNKAVLFTLGQAIIPSKEFETEKGIQKSQPQIHTGNIAQEIAPGETAEIPLEGYCLDVGKPPVPNGENFVGFDDWVRIEKGSDDNPIPAPDALNPAGPNADELPPSFKPIQKGIVEIPPPDEMNPDGPNNSEWDLTYPGTDKPFNYTIDISEHPEDAARIVFPIVEKITRTYDQLQQNEEIKTPFSQDENRQREAVIQQAIWMTSSLLQGQMYGKEDFGKRMEEQYEEASGVNMDEAPKEQKEQFENGINQFWDTFELVGEKAKVIKKKDLSPETKRGDEEANDCCDELRNGKAHIEFDMGNGKYVKLVDNNITTNVGVPSGSHTIIPFSFDIEDAFCNLDNNQITNRTSRLCRQDSRENSETNRTIALAGPTSDIEGRNPNYGLRYMEQLNINGEIKEMAISINVDKATCKASVQVLFDEKIYESSGPPIYSYEELDEYIYQLRNPEDSYFWNRLLFYWAEHYKYSGDEQEDFKFYITEKMKDGINELLEQEIISSTKAQELLNSLSNEDEITGILMELAYLTQ